jgi:hypothetical protein
MRALQEVAADETRISEAGRNPATGRPSRYRQDMPDHLVDWRRALELLASLPEGATEALLITASNPRSSLD